MAFGTSGVTGPAQTASSNPIPELNPANPRAGSPAKATPMPVDTVMRSDAPTNPDAYHDAIVKFSGGSDVTAHSASAETPTATASNALTSGTPAAKPTPMPVDAVTRSGPPTSSNAYFDAIAKFAGGSDEPAHAASATTHAGTAPAQTVRASHAATTHTATTAQTRATAHVQATTLTPATTSSQVTSVPSTDHSTNSSQSVADMGVAAKVSATARAGIASAAKDAEGSLKTALSDPKTQATLAGAAAFVVGAQFVPGLDVAVDVTLGAAGVGMYLSAGSQHQANLMQAYGKLKDYASEVGSAKTQADLDKASKDFADFVKLGGSEAIEAAGTLAGGTVAVGKAAAAVKAAGGIEGLAATTSQLASKAGEVIKSTAKAAMAKVDAFTQQVIEGMGGAPELATAGGGRLEMRATPEAIRPTGSSGTRNVNGSTSAEASAGGAKATPLLEGKNPETITGLHPNATYEFEGGFKYHTDAQGRVKQVEATITPDVTPGDRSGTLQRAAGGVDRLSTDEGGHLIATRFNGPAHEVNHIAQDITLNRGKFKKLENSWAKNVDAGKTVNVKIDLTYPGGSQRPSNLIVNHTVDGVKQRTQVFANEAPQE